MSFSRRHALRLGLAAGALPFAPRGAIAQAAPHTFKLGAAEVTIVSSGTMTLPLSFLLPETEAKDAAALSNELAQGIKVGVTAVVVKTGNATVVIDSGGSADFMPSLGSFAESFEKTGIDPASVTHVIFTHAHPDHLWGVIDPLDDDTRFPNAQHSLTATELDFWLKPGLAETLPDALKGSALGTARRLGMIGKRIQMAKPGAEIVPGITLIGAAGHTPGHVVVRLDFGGNTLLVGGDAIGNAIVSFAKPDWPWGADMDRAQGAATRKRLLDQLATDKAQLIGTHLPWPGLGRVERYGSAYRFVQG